MIIIYYLSYLIAASLLIVSTWTVLYNIFSLDRFRGIVSKSIKDGVDKASIKVSSILFYFARKGYIKIRKDEDGRIYLDKLSNYEGIEELKELFDNIYSENVTFHSDDTAIMSYETVPWEIVEKKFSNIVKQLQDKLGFERKTVNKKSFFKLVGIKKIQSIIFLNWIVCLLPISIAYAREEEEEFWVSLIAIYVVYGLIYVLAKTGIKMIKALRELWKRVSDSLFLLNAIIIIFYIFIGIGYFCLIGFAIAMLSVTGEIVVGAIELNMYLGVALYILTALMYLIRFKYKDPDILFGLYRKQRKNKDVKKNELSETKSIETLNDLILDIHEFDKIKNTKQEQPVWYEGDEWTSIRDIEHKLEVKS